jgi:hypothetical protein
MDDDEINIEGKIIIDKKITETARWIIYLHKQNSTVGKYSPNVRAHISMLALPNIYT